MAVNRRAPAVQMRSGPRNIRIVAPTCDHGFQRSLFEVVSEEAHGQYILSFSRRPPEQGN
ncbi:MAG TPA: hypothetical protein VHB50_14170 [Bryobacteraceae bacterium]|nr:hypothetical protein [Bryobacteraceae bacterium]